MVSKALIPWLLLAATLLVLAALGLYLGARYLARREPYHTFVSLSVRQKLAFMKLVVTDPRVPRWIKLLPFLMAAYLASPIDLIPDFLPVLGYLDDVALVLLVVAAIVRFTPRAVVTELLDEARKPRG